MVVVTEDKSLAGVSLRTKAMRASSCPTMTDTMTDTTAAHCSLLSSLDVSATHLRATSNKLGACCGSCNSQGQALETCDALADELHKNAEAG